MRIYTRKGDRGSTGLLFGGERISKADPRVDAYGTTDEAVSALGLARAVLEDRSLGELVIRLQRELFVVGAELATHTDRRARLTPGVSLVTGEMVAALEREIDALGERHPMPAEFVVPGETPPGAALDLARAIVRRAERAAVALDRDGRLPGSSVIPYLNRLADLLFVMGRAADGAYRPVREEPQRLEGADATADSKPADEAPPPAQIEEPVEPPEPVEQRPAEPPTPAPKTTDADTQNERGAAPSEPEPEDAPRVGIAGMGGQSVADIARERIAEPASPDATTLDEAEVDRIFSRSVALFNQARYWHAHEGWEILWRAADERDRDFYQGLIQIAAGLLHLQRRNARGARNKLSEGIARLSPYQPKYRGIVVDELVARASTLLGELEAGGMPYLVPPVIRLVP
ncbi:MAG: cob(I)yrinic acid a,c-diamide adenosyltransferase [Candidatus Limnocylindria bacterium]